MASLKKILYVIGLATNGDDTKYMSINDICEHFSDESSNHKVLANRINSQIGHHMNLFAVKRIGKRKFWKLNANGNNYLNKFKDVYDPNTDRMLFQPDRIEVF